MGLRHAPGPGCVRSLGFWACLVLSACSGPPQRAEPPRTDVAKEPQPSTPPPRRDILGKKLAQKKQVYSQHNEELIIRDFFQDRRDGVFLDVGCAGPIKDSNTFFLEKELGWSGIGVDALPDYAAVWKRDRPRSRFFNFLVTDHLGAPERFYRSKLLGLSSTVPRKTFGGKEIPYTEIRIPTTTLTKLLEDNRLARVDFVSMDIEGAELLALSGFDIERFRPELLCVEWFHAGREKLVAFFAAHGYERIDRYIEYDGVNDYFTPKPKS